ncbi:MAG: hypothetical protein PHN49_09620, partial [Candidatus Omnitrophica bacterium]|nr:hypothetical protein [Candidatus Omnitrophota bacterium]
DESFDIVISSYMVHHIRTPGKVAVFLSEVYRIAREGWLIADFDRRIYAPLLVGVAGFLLSGSRTLVSDGVKSVRRAYRAAEVNFILEEVRKAKKMSGMDCVSYPLFPYWMIRGRKSGDSV